MQSPDILKKEKIATQKTARLQQERPISRAVVVRIIVGIILLLTLVHIGFYKTYISHFPGFNDYVTTTGRKVHFTWIMHFHGMALMGWILMLLLQPILILKGKIKWHRRVGYLSYVLAPLVVLSIWLATEARFHETLEQRGYRDAVARLSLTLPNIIFFAFLYLLALYFRKQTALHATFMCSTAFLLIAPGLARMLRTYFEFTPDTGATIAKLVVVAIAALVTIVDSVRRKSISPFAVALAITLALAVLWISRYTPLWQSVAGMITKMFRE